MRVVIYRLNKALRAKAPDFDLVHTKEKVFKWKYKKVGVLPMYRVRGLTFRAKALHRRER